MLAKYARAGIAALVVVGVLAGAATAATASPADDAQAAASSFLNAWAVRDGQAACRLLTPDALAKFGGETTCEQSFSQNDEQSADDDAQQTLLLAFVAARQIARAHRNAFTSKTFTLKRLAAAIDARVPSIDVRLGGGPLAAKGQLSTTAVLDTRSTARRAVFYAESDSGDILRASGAPSGGFDLQLVAQGIPETGPKAPQPPAFTFVFGDVFAASDGSVLLDTQLSSTDPKQTEKVALLLRLVPVGGHYLVDDLFVSVTDLGG